MSQCDILIEGNINKDTFTAATVTTPVVSEYYLKILKEEIFGDDFFSSMLKNIGTYGAANTILRTVFKVYLSTLHLGMEYCETDRSMGTVHAVVHKVKSKDIENNLAGEDDYVVVDLTTAQHSNNAQDITIKSSKDKN